MTGRIPAFRLAAGAALCALLAACASAPGGPSLAPRAAEAIDPRLPVADRSAALPADPQWLADLAALEARARDTAAAAEPALAAAQAAASGAGPRESDSWIAAQQSLSAAVAARAPFAATLADFDALIARRAVEGRRTVPADLAAATRTEAALRAIDTRQAEALERVRARLQGP